MDAGSVALMVDQPAGESFDVVVSELGGVAVVSVRGDVDVATSPRLTSAGSDVAAGASGGLVLDLTEVTLLSSSGLTALLRTVEKLPAGSTAAMVAPHPAVQRPIVLSGLDRVIVTVGTVEDAVAAVAPPSRSDQE